MNCNLHWQNLRAMWLKEGDANSIFSMKWLQVEEEITRSLLMKLTLKEHMGWKRLEVKCLIISTMVLTQK